MKTFKELYESIRENSYIEKLNKAKTENDFEEIIAKMHTDKIPNPTLKLITKGFYGAFSGNPNRAKMFAMLKTKFISKSLSKQSTEFFKTFKFGISSS